MIPVIGDAAKYGKWATRAGKSTRYFRRPTTAARYAKLVEEVKSVKVADALWDSGTKFKGKTLGSNKLRDNLIKGGKSLNADWQAHHIFPVELIQKNRVVREAVEQGFDFNGVVNGLALEKWRHNGRHPDAMIDYIEKSINDLNDGSLNSKEILEKVAKEIKDKIEANPKTKVNDVVWE